MYSSDVASQMSCFFCPPVPDWQMWDTVTQVEKGGREGPEECVYFDSSVAAAWGEHFVGKAPHL